MNRTTLLAIAFIAIGCSVPSGTNHNDGGNPINDGSLNGDVGDTVSDGGSDGNTTMGGPMSCPGPGNPKPTGGGCGVERWSIKVGTDSQAHSIQLVAVPTTIAALIALPANGGGNSRSSPTETTIYELKNVVLTQIKGEPDNDYHMVLSDGSHTLISEVPAPACDNGSTWSCYISRARSNVDAKYNVGSPQYPAATVTVRGVAFFDFNHGQTGVAPNAIEIHPVLQICFGQNCTPS